MITTTFDDILDAAEKLPPEDQENLIYILQSSLRDKHRDERIRDVKEAQQEFAEGKCQPVTPEELMEEILG